MKMSRITAGGHIGIGTVHPSQSFNVSGSYISQQKNSHYILTANIMTFNTHITLGKSIEDKKRNEYVFVERPKDIDEDGKIEILDDFCLNPNISEILKVINKDNKVYV